MKRVHGWVFAGITLLLFSFRGLENMDAIAMAIQSGNVTQLSPYLDSRVDITLPEKSDTYSKTQAEMVIGDFFNNNIVENFKITQQGESGGITFCAGLLQTQSGNYRTTIFFKQKADKHFLREIRFQSVE